MINFLLLNIISMFLINLLKINSLKKIIFFMLINFVAAAIVAVNFINFLELFIILFCALFIFINCYTIKYSSVRIKILNNLKINKKIISEIDLYNDRKKRFVSKNPTFMRQNLFFLINYVVKFFRKILI